MKYISRTLAVAASLAAAAPAFANGDHVHADAVQTLIHWLSQPVHSAPIVAVIALVGLVAYSRRQRG